MRLRAAVILIVGLSELASAQTTSYRQAMSGWNNIGSVSPAIILICLALFFLASSFLIWMSRRGKPVKLSVDPPREDYRAVSFVMLLRNAFDFSDLFEGLAQKSNFESPGERERILHKIADSISPEDVLAIASREVAAGRDLFDLNERAFEYFKSQSAAADIREEVFNPRTPTHTRCNTKGEPAKPDSVCLFGIVFASKANYAEPEGDTAAQLALFHRLAFHSPQEHNMGMYFYFTPVPGRGLNLDRGTELFRRAVDVI